MKPLTRKEEGALFKEYGRAKKKIHTLLLSDPECVRELYKIYKDKKFEGKSLAKLTKNYNNKKPGHNRRLSLHIKSMLDNKILDPDKLELSEQVYIQLEKRAGKEIKKNIEREKEKVKGIEEKIVQSCRGAAKEIANKYSNIFGIDIEDVEQEANIAILESIKKYNPRFKTQDGKKVKFLTYAYYTAERRVKDFIMNSSRLIRLPRHQLDRVFLILEAGRLIDSEHQSTENIASVSNLILSSRKGKLLSNNEKLTEEDISFTLRLLENVVHIDQSIGNNQTIKDIIPDTEIDDPEKKDSLRRMKEILITELSPKELRVIELRYLSDKIVPYSKIEKKIKGVNRSEIKSIEKEALEKLKKHRELASLFNKSIG